MKNEIGLCQKTTEKNNNSQVINSPYYDEYLRDFYRNRSLGHWTQFKPNFMHNEVSKNTQIAPKYSFNIREIKA